MKVPQPPSVVARTQPSPVELLLVAFTVTELPVEPPTKERFELFCQVMVAPTGGLLKVNVRFVPAQSNEELPVITPFNGEHELAQL